MAVFSIKLRAHEVPKAGSQSPFVAAAHSQFNTSRPENGNEAMTEQQRFALSRPLAFASGDAQPFRRLVFPWSIILTVNK